MTNSPPDPARDSSRDPARDLAPATAPTPAPARQSLDPVRAKRAVIKKWSLLANRIGYLLWAVAMAVFIIGFAVGFNNAVSTVVITCLVAGCVLLAPTIIVGYAVKAAEREDRQRGV